MTSPGHPTRLLILPAALLAAIIGLVTIIPNLTPRPTQPLGQLDMPTEFADEVECRRGREDPDPRHELPLDAGRVTSSMIVACPTAFDGRRVTYVGELVGDLLHREGGGWVMVNDDDYALAYGPLPTHREHRGTNAGLSVWLPSDLHDEITGLGRPNQRGDVVQLEGHIRRTDPDDGGGLTLRTDQLTILTPSEQITEPLDRPQAMLALASLLAGAALWLVRRRSSR